MFKSLINKKKRKEIIKKIKNAFNKHPLIKFFLVTFIILAYFIFAIHSHGIKHALNLSLIAWSFFVLCTPIPDAGILIDLPLRLITGIKMVYSEIIVWIIAISINIFYISTNLEVYNKTILLSLFKHILTTPFPYWIIILLSLFGTFFLLSVGDNLLEHKKKKLFKYRMIILTFIIVLIILLYDFLLNQLNVHIPLI